MLRAQHWDFRSLFSNLGQIWNTWSFRQQQVIAEWEARGRKGHKPVYTFPPDFAHEVILPHDVAADIVADKFYPVPDQWRAAARQRLPTPPICPGTALPTETNRRSRPRPTATIRPDHLLVVDVVANDKRKIVLSELETPNELSAVVDLYRQSGSEIRPDTLTRLRFLAEECDAAARQHNSTGTEWLTTALKRGLGVADDLIAYTAGILRDWITHGPQSDVRPTREGYRRLAYSGPAVQDRAATVTHRDWDTEQ